MSQFFESHETMVVTVVGVVAAVVVLLNIVLKVWPFVSKLVTMVNGFVGYNNEPGVLDRLKTLEANSEADSHSHETMVAQLDRLEASFHAFKNESVQDRQHLWAIALEHHPTPQEEE